MDSSSSVCIYSDVLPDVFFSITVTISPSTTESSPVPPASNAAMDLY